VLRAAALHENQPSPYNFHDFRVDETAPNYSSEEDLGPVSFGGSGTRCDRQPKLRSPTDFHSLELQHSVAHVKQMYEQGNFDHEVIVKHGECLRYN
jgi:hypothetical protein